MDGDGARRTGLRTLAACVLLALGVTAAPLPDHAGAAGQGAAVPTATAARETTVDCNSPTACPELVVDGDPPATLPSGAPSPLRGYSDPTIRRGPDASTVWMAYSWPSVHIDPSGSRSTRVETHLARSTDDGRRWRSGKPLWSAEPVVDPVSGQRGWTDHEVPNLLPVRDETGSTRWIGARLDLFVPDGGTLGKRPPSSFRIVVVSAGSPRELSSGPSAVLGSAGTDERWGVDQDLSALDDSLAGCTVWNEPALHHADGTLYLALRCLALGGTGTPNVAGSTIEVFATEAEGEPTSWRWRHQGRLAGHAEALELGGDGLTQIDFASSRGGRLLAILTPDSWSTEHREFVHHGLRVVEVSSLDEPRLRRRDDGSLAVRAVVTASDLEPLGPGAGTYEPTAATGIILMRREITPASLVGTINDTRVHP